MPTTRSSSPIAACHGQRLITLAGDRRRVAAAPPRFAPPICRRPARLSGRKAGSSAAECGRDISANARILPVTSHRIHSKNGAGWTRAHPATPTDDHPARYLMKSLKHIGLAFGASIALSSAAFAQDVTVAVAGPMTGGESRLRPPDEERRRDGRADINTAGGVNGKKLALSVEDDACDPKQARSGRREDREREDAVRRRALLLVVVDPRLGSLCRRQPCSRSPPLHQSEVHRQRPVERGAGVRRPRDDQQGLVAAQYIAKNFKGKNIAILNDKPPTARVWPTRPRRRSTRRYHREDVRVLQQGRQGLQRDRLAPEA